MKKRLAIITGASGGLGREFVSLMCREMLDEVWCIARNSKKLEAVKKEFGDKVIILPLDLIEEESLVNVKEMLKTQQPNVVYLINNAAIGEVLGSYSEGDYVNNNKTINLNCSSVVALCDICIPFMEKGGRIINLSSQSSFQPVPYINLYAATKAFVTSYSRGLNVELKSIGITSTAVCAGWTETDMLPKTLNNKKIKYPGITPPQRVAVKALKDAKKGKDMSVCTAYVKWMRLISKIFPHSLVMKGWVKSIYKYL